MCTLHLFHDSAKAQHLKQITDDWSTNEDGASAILLDQFGNVYFRFQTTDLRCLLSVIKTSKAARYVVHLRAATTSTQGVSGCHGFDSDSGEWIYFHNGVIFSSDSFRHRVDSLALGDELDNHDDIDSGRYVWLPDWSRHNFANVIAYHTFESELFVHRSHHGRLHHDGAGNWSTNPINGAYLPVEPGWYAGSGDTIHTYDDNTPTLSQGRRIFR